MNRVAALTEDALVAFATFAKHRNFTRAAEDLFISQPSLHTKITKLGAALGTKLYERDGRRIELTDDGRALAAYASDQRRAAEDFLAHLDGHEAKRPLTIAGGPTVSRWLLSDGFRRLVKSGMLIKLIPADASEALELVDSGGADVAAVGYSPPPKHLDQFHLCDSSQVVLTPRSHQIAKHSQVTLGVLDGERLIVPSRGRPHRETLERELSAAHVDWDVASEADGWDLIVHLASLGVGLAVVNDLIPPRKPLVATPISDLPSVGYWLAWRPARRNLANLLIESIGPN